MRIKTAPEEVPGPSPKATGGSAEKGFSLAARCCSDCARMRVFPKRKGITPTCADPDWWEWLIYY